MQCPICGSQDLEGIRPNGDIIFTAIWCNNCRGVPASCNGVKYVHSGNASLSDCEQCGERRAGLDTHVLFTRETPHI